MYMYTHIDVPTYYVQVSEKRIYRNICFPGTCTYVWILFHSVISIL